MTKMKKCKGDLCQKLGDSFKPNWLWVGVNNTKTEQTKNDGGCIS